jgi:PAS domain S-box-containing protein
MNSPLTENRASRIPTTLDPEMRGESDQSSRHRYLAKLLDTLEVGVLVADDAAVYVYVNRAACELFDRPPSDMMGHHLSEFIDPARGVEVGEQWEAFLSHGVQTGTFSIRLPDGSPRMFQFKARANFVPGLHCSFITPIFDRWKANANDLTICAWTKRIRVGQQWLSIEDYLFEVHGLRASHGICPEAVLAF